jgi:hypothetical protein
MNSKLNIGEVTPEEYNIIMKQLTMGQLGECLDLFMRFRQIGMQFQQEQTQQPQVVPPPAK